MQATLEREPAVEAALPGSQRRRLQQRGRGAVLSGLVLFVLLQAGLMVGVEARPELRDPTFEIKVRRFVELVKQQPAPTATVVFLGSSMSVNGMKADMVAAPASAALGRPVIGFNLATNGAGPLANLIYLKRVLRRGIHPDMVVIELSPLFFDAAQAKLDVLRFPAHAVEHGDLDTLERHADVPGLRGDWWRARLVPILGQRAAILQQSASVAVPFDDRAELWRDADRHGWRGRPALAPDEHERVLSDVKSQFKTRLATYRMDDAPLKALRELAEELARERIAGILVVMPAGPTMRSLYGPNADAPLMDEFRTLSRKHGFPLIDATAWFGEESFRDSYHLHENAAADFTSRLVREAIIPALIPAGSLTQSRRGK